MAGCSVLLKGAETCVARSDGIVALHNRDGRRSAPWLATAGSGDVLAGMITGLLARGFAPAEAAECAVWLHAECARRFGPGLIAEDLTETLPSVFRGLGI
jgi:NAD(P)H-hydrate repair Nnr-like enzyme with NAD(P)H-hydrate dehydratase domain